MYVAYDASIRDLFSPQFTSIVRKNWGLLIFVCDETEN